MVPNSPALRPSRGPSGVSAAVTTQVAPADREALLRRTLSADEIRLAASYLFDRLSQQRLASTLGMPAKQTTVGARLRRIMSKLEAAGFPVRRPARRAAARPAWMPARATVVRVEPAALGRMVTERDESGTVRGRWLDATKPDRSDADMNSLEEFAPRRRR